MRNVTILLAVAAVLALSSPAHGAHYTWISDDEGTWNDSTNWSSGNIPSNDPAKSTAIGNGKGKCKVAGTATAGTLYTQDWFKWTTQGLGDGATLVVESGSLTVYTTFYNGSGAADRNGYTTISGGSVDIQGTFYQGQTTAKGYLTVDGAGASSITMANYDDYNDTTNLNQLKFTLGGGTDPIQQIDITGSPKFGGTDLVVDGTAAVGTYVLLTYSTVQSNFHSTDKPAGWTVTHNTDTDLVTPGVQLGTIVYVPEPATLALLALGGIGVLLRRRK